MKRFILFYFLLLFGFTNAQQRPKLVVGIVVDQMKVDYLNRFYDDFSNDGFKRLINSGFSYQNMNYNYVPTYTAPGHASIYTGATPSVHGIIGNEYFNRSLGKDQYCTDDSSVKTLGNGSAKEGEMSPKNLQTTTITDELRLTTNFKGKVIGMSLKDRGAILPAGHFANWAFWFSKTGNFISSSFYGAELPKWVTQFNDEKHYLPYLSSDWNLLQPIANYNESLADDNPYEGKMPSTTTSTFPYKLKDILDKNDPSIIRSTPFGNDLLAEFAVKAIENEDLGKDEITDFLTISFSSTDYVGHQMGPRSMELQDTYLRLDLTLAKLLNYLDSNVGKDNYLLFLTADHAGAENAKFLKDNKYNVDAVSPKSIENGLKEFSIATFQSNLIKDFSNFNIYFDKEIIREKALDLSKVKQAFVTYLMTQPQVKRVYTEEEILNSTGNDYFLNFIAKGYDPNQNGDLVILDKPGYIEYGLTGTSHGTAYPYDTHVPMLFYGWKIPHGESFAKKVITQIAPTLALKLKITMPNGTEGEVLEEILK